MSAACRNVGSGVQVVGVPLLNKYNTDQYLSVKIAEPFVMQTASTPRHDAVVPDCRQLRRVFRQPLTARRVPQSVFLRAKPDGGRMKSVAAGQN